MKRSFHFFLLIVVSILVFSGCACKHEWVEANCTAPKTCELCGETEGEPLPHNFADATCTLRKTCTVCNAVEGSALGHQWIDATYSEPKTCEVCGETEGRPLLRTDLGMDNDSMAEAISQITQVLGYNLTFLGFDEDGWPVYDMLEISTGASSNVGITFEPTADGSLVYSIAIYSNDVTDLNATAMLSVVATAALLGFDENFDTELLTQTLQGQPEYVDDVAIYFMESCGLYAELQVSDTFVVFWIYPAE